MFGSLFLVACFSAVKGIKIRTAGFKNPQSVFFLKTGVHSDI
jgi:hypothetical protein